MKTVSELIADLQKLPGDYEVQVYGQGSFEGCPCIPELDVIHPDQGRPKWLRHGGRNGGLVTICGGDGP